MKDNLYEKYNIDQNQNIIFVDDVLNKLINDTTINSTTNSISYTTNTTTTTVIANKNTRNDQITTKLDKKQSVSINRLVWYVLAFLITIFKIKLNHHLVNK